MLWRKSFKKHPDLCFQNLVPRMQSALWKLYSMQLSVCVWGNTSSSRGLKSCARVCLCVNGCVCLSILQLQVCKLVRGQCQGSHCFSLDGPSLPPCNMLTSIQRHQACFSCFYSQIHRKKNSTNVYMHTPANLFAHKAHCTVEMGIKKESHESSLGMELFLISAWSCAMFGFIYSPGNSVLDYVCMYLCHVCLWRTMHIKPSVVNLKTGTETS